MIIRDGVITPHALYLRWFDPDIDEPPLESEYAPTSAGVMNYVHTIQALYLRYGSTSNHPPDPLHSFQTQGTNYLAQQRCSVEDRRDKVVGKVYGASYPDYKNGSEPDHSFVAVGHIRLADKVESLCHIPHDCIRPQDRLLRCSCDAFRVPENHCIRPIYLLPRTTVHELVHAVLDVVDSDAPCDFTGRSGLMQGSCLFDDRFGGWASSEHILLMQRGETTKN